MKKPVLRFVCMIINLVTKLAFDLVTSSTMFT